HRAARTGHVARASALRADVSPGESLAAHEWDSDLLERHQPTALPQGGLVRTRNTLIHTVVFCIWSAHRELLSAVCSRGVPISAMLPAVQDKHLSRCSHACALRHAPKVLRYDVASRPIVCQS